jgi:hypothetical protein
LYTKLKFNYNRLWFLSLHDDKIKDFGNKLRTYRLFKNNISLEPYLSMKNDEQRILHSDLSLVYKKCFKFVFEFITNLKSSFKYFNKDRIVLYQLFLFWSDNNFDTERAI